MEDVTYYPTVSHLLVANNADLPISRRDPNRLTCEEEVGHRKIRCKACTLASWRCHFNLTARWQILELSREMSHSGGSGWAESIDFTNLTTTLFAETVNSFRRGPIQRRWNHVRHRIVRRTSYLIVIVLSTYQSKSVDISASAIVRQKRLLSEKLSNRTRLLGH